MGSLRGDAVVLLLLIAIRNREVYTIVVGVNQLYQIRYLNYPLVIYIHLDVGSIGSESRTRT